MVAANWSLFLATVAQHALEKGATGGNGAEGVVGVLAANDSRGLIGVIRYPQLAWLHRPFPAIR